MRPSGVDLVSGAVLPALFAVLALTAGAALALPATTTIGLAVTATALVVAVAIAGLEWVGCGLLTVAVATSTWNAVAYGSIKPTHAALAAAAVVLGLMTVTSGRAVHVPRWVWLLGASVALAALFSLVAPPSAAYFTARYIGDLPDDVAATAARLGAAGLITGLQWLVAAVALPVVFCLALASRPRWTSVLADAWAVGAAVSAAVALADRLGLTQVSAGLLPETDPARQAGLSVHPNHLALTIVMALPVVVLRLSRARGPAGSILWAGLGLVMLAGVVASGSRAGLVGVVLALAASVVADPRARRHLPLLAVIGSATAVLALATMPAAAASLASDLRISDSDTAAASDEIRSGLLTQALDDIAHAPLHGVGLTVVAEGHNIYLQLLAGGGVLLFVGYLVAQLGFLRTAWTVHDGGTGLGRAVAVSGGVYLVIGVVGNQLTDVFAAVPLALAAGLWAAERAVARRDAVAAGDVRQVPEREEITA